MCLQACNISVQFLVFKSSIFSFKARPKKERVELVSNLRSLKKTKDAIRILTQVSPETREKILKLKTMTANHTIIPAVKDTKAAILPQAEEDFESIVRPTGCKIGSKLHPGRCF